MYAWWKSDRKHNYWRTYGGDFEIRRWLSKEPDTKPLSGHHIGVYAQMLTYDLNWVVVVIWVINGLMVVE